MFVEVSIGSILRDQVDVVFIMEKPVERDDVLVVEVLLDFYLPGEYFLQLILDDEWFLYHFENT